MGFTTGFTGGVTLTLGLAYLTVLAHQRNRERQSAILRANNYVVSGITDPLPPVYPPTRFEQAAKERDNFVETAKDKWNAELEREVRWVQNTDWDEVREGVETAVGRLWSTAIGKAVDETQAGEEKASAFATSVKDEAKREANEQAGSVANAAKTAYADAVNKTQKGAEEAKGSIFDAVSRGVAKGKEALGIANQKLAGAEKVIEGKIGEELSPVEQALAQRYQKPSNSNQTIEEALAERYTPIDQRNNAVLRGV